MRILLVENNIACAKARAAFLRSEKLIVEMTDTGEEALDLLRHYPFDLVLLDLALPDMEGTVVISRLRSAGRDTPILALAGVSNAGARLSALSAGADDVVEQSIDRAELLGRMRAIVRRSGGHSQSLLRVGALTLNVEQQEVLVGDCSVALTGKEFALLQLLVLRKNMVLSKDVILSHLYGGMDEPATKIVDVFICKIRSKLAKAGLRDVIGTVWGRGYTVREAWLEKGVSPPPLPVTQPAIRLTRAVP